MISIEFLKVPMLDWDDRRIEYQIAFDNFKKHNNDKVGEGFKPLE